MRSLNLKKLDIETYIYNMIKYSSLLLKNLSSYHKKSTHFTNYNYIQLVSSSLRY